MTTIKTTSLESGFEQGTSKIQVRCVFHVPINLRGDTERRNVMVSNREILVQTLTCIQKFPD